MPRVFASTSGFTLVEMLLVVSLGIIVAGIAVPNFVAMNSSYRLSTASALVTSRVHQARANALKRNQPVWVRVDGAARTVQVQTLGAGGVPVNVDAPERLPQGIAFGTGTAVVQLTFDSMGRPLNPPQTLQLLFPGSGLTRTITVTSTGRVSVN